MCDEGFWQMSSLELHITNVHLKMEINKKYDSKPIESSTFTQNVKIEKDCHKYDDILMKKFICHMCKNSFDLPMSLKDHILDNHGSLKIYNAFVKNMSENNKFKHLDSNKKKQIIHEEENSEILLKHNHSSYNCKICKKIIKDKWNFQRHIASCHEKKKFKCDLCEKKFSRHYNLLEHKNIVHYGIKPEKIFDCNNCSKAYASKSELHRHINIIHKNIRYKCDLCQKEFTRQKYVLEHKRLVHDGIKPEKIFDCGNCSKTYSSSPTLLV